MSRAKTTKKKMALKVFPISTENLKISQKKFPIPLEEVDELKQLANKKIVFSFRFLELYHKAFNLGGTCSNWSNDLFKMLMELSAINRNEFVNLKREHYRSHTHDWDSLAYCYDLDMEFLEQVECRQARISTSKGGIHGFMIGNRFYVVWLDPQHNLYPDDRHGGVKIFQPPETCCGYRDKELERMTEKLKEYEKLLEEYTCPSNS